MMPDDLDHEVCGYSDKGFEVWRKGNINRIEGFNPALVCTPIYGVKQDKPIPGESLPKLEKKEQPGACVRNGGACQLTTDLITPIKPIAYNPDHFYQSYPEPEPVTGQPVTEPVTGNFNTFLNGEYVEIGTYFGKKPNAKEGPETDRISAIVRSILSDDQKNIFLKYGNVFGCSEKPHYDSCGKVIGKVMCSADKSHKAYLKHERCNDPLCKVCYPKFTHVIAENATGRIVGYTDVYGNDPIYHLVFWPKKPTVYKGMEDAMQAAGVMLKAMGAKMAAVLYHPYRITKAMQETLREYKYKHNLPSDTGFWKMAHDDVLQLGTLAAYIEYYPHFHAMASGYLMDAGEYASLDIGGYKKVRFLHDAKEVETALNYIATHSCKEAGKQCVRYFGAISYSKLGRGAGYEKTIDIVCEKCAAPMQEFYASADDCGIVTVDRIKYPHITRRIMVYKYYRIYAVNERKPRIRKVQP